MAKIIMTCGKICSGKTTYSKELAKKNSAVLLSIDEIMLAMFGQYVGDMHDEYCVRTEKYLFFKSVEIIKTGINVVLDWGFWTNEERLYAKQFYKSYGIEYEFHYIDICNETWQARLDKRNKAVLEKQVDAYFVDENLAKKFDSIFEPPKKEEIDVWIEC